MEIHPLLKGYFYPSSRVSRCPKFHACIASKKCQNYDRNDYLCNVCESRVTPATNLGGYRPESAYVPDIQESTKLIQLAARQAMAHPDSELKTINGKQITDKYNRLRKAQEDLEMFSKMTKTELDAETLRAMNENEF